jgi:hypothetical protein
MRLRPHDVAQSAHDVAVWRGVEQHEQPAGATAWGLVIVEPNRVPLFQPPLHDIPEIQGVERTLVIGAAAGRVQDGLRPVTRPEAGLGLLPRVGVVGSLNDLDGHRCVEHAHEPLDVPASREPLSQGGLGQRALEQIIGFGWMAAAPRSLALARQSARVISGSVCAGTT